AHLAARRAQRLLVAGERREHRADALVAVPLVAGRRARAEPAAARSRGVGVDDLARHAVQAIALVGLGQLAARQRLADALAGDARHVAPEGLVAGGDPGLLAAPAGVGGLRLVIARDLEDVRGHEQVAVEL